MLALISYSNRYTTQRFFNPALTRFGLQQAIAFIHLCKGMKKNLFHLVSIIAASLFLFHAQAQNGKASGTDRYKDNFFIKAVASKAACMVNEPVLIDYKLYTSLHFAPKPEQQKMPTFTGCTVQEMVTAEVLPTIEKIKGKAFYCFSIRKVQIYPLHAGDLTIGAISLESSLPNEPGKSNGQVFTTSSQPLTLHVSAFPESSKPANFGGAVGSFTIKASISKTNDTANENNNLQLVIEGEGSFQNIDCPSVIWPSNMEAFETSASEVINKVSYPASGSKTFNIPFIAKAKGKYTIAPISFSFYDMNSHAYRTVFTEEIVLHVTDAKPIVDETKMHGDITNHQYIWIVPAIAIIAGISLWLRFGFSRKRKPQQIVAKADEMIEQEITKQEEQAAAREETDAEKLNKLLLCENDNAFFSQAKIFTQYLLQKETDSIRRNSLQEIINDCNAVLYASSAHVSKDAILIRLEAMVEQL
jgi:hypothetical protein